MKGLSNSVLVNGTMRNISICTSGGRMYSVTLRCLGDIGRVLSGAPFGITCHAEGRFLLCIMGGLPCAVNRSNARCDERGIVTATLSRVADVGILSHVRNSSAGIPGSLLTRLGHMVERRLLGVAKRSSRVRSMSLTGLSRVRRHLGDNCADF